MKVICIDTSNPKNPDLLHQDQYIKEGEVYTICGFYLDNDDGHEYYYLEEKQMKPVASYRANRFLPLSDIQERQKIKNKNFIENY